MKIAVPMMLCVLLLPALASARPMSHMEWMDPKSGAIWESLTDQEKLESVVAVINEQQEPLHGMTHNDLIMTDQEISDIAAKAKVCIDKELAEPDMKDEEIPLYHISSFCTQKYVNIWNKHKMKKKMAEIHDSISKAHDDSQ